MHVGLRVRVCVVSGTTVQVSGLLADGDFNPRRIEAAAYFRVLAECANERQDDGERQRVLFTIVDADTPHLDTGVTAHWWNELLHCLTRAEAARTVGAAWDEAGVDWDARAVEATQTLAGQR